MENLVIEAQTLTDDSLLSKLLNTVQEYRERYPELGYIISGMEVIRQQNPQEEFISLMVRLNAYMRDKLDEYYVIRVTQHKFQQDLEALQANTYSELEGNNYLEFLNYKPSALK